MLMYVALDGSTVADIAIAYPICIPPILTQCLCRWHSAG